MSNKIEGLLHTTRSYISERERQGNIKQSLGSLRRAVYEDNRELLRTFNHYSENPKGLKYSIEYMQDNARPCGIKDGRTLRKKLDNILQVNSAEMGFHFSNRFGVNRLKFTIEKPIDRQLWNYEENSGESVLPPWEQTYNFKIPEADIEASLPPMVMKGTQWERFNGLCIKTTTRDVPEHEPVYSGTYIRLIEYLDLLRRDGSPFLLRSPKLRIGSSVGR